jgi:hypothetical protein
MSRKKAVSLKKPLSRGDPCLVFLLRLCSLRARLRGQANLVDPPLALPAPGPDSVSADASTPRMAAPGNPPIENRNLEICDLVDQGSKHQIPSTKSQTNPKHEISRFQTERVRQLLACVQKPLREKRLCSRLRSQFLAALRRQKEAMGQLLESVLKAPLSHLMGEGQGVRALGIGGQSKHTLTPSPSPESGRGELLEQRIGRLGHSPQGLRVPWPPRLAPRVWLGGDRPATRPARSGSASLARLWMRYAPRGPARLSRFLTTCDCA